jgi:hypothetical protein
VHHTIYRYAAKVLSTPVLDGTEINTYYSVNVNFLSNDERLCFPLDVDRHVHSRTADAAHLSWQITDTLPSKEDSFEQIVTSTRRTLPGRTGSISSSSNVAPAK